MGEVCGKSIASVNGQRRSYSPQDLSFERSLRGTTFHAFERPTHHVDSTDWAILAELQTDCRLSFSELGRRVHMSSPAVAERVRRLEQSGVITGYHASVDPTAAGWTVLALVRMQCFGPRCVLQHVERVIAWPHVIEVHRVTGDVCCELKILAASMPDFEAVVDRLAEFGQPSSTLVLSSPLGRGDVHQPDS
jgi:Lrp/AsnC family transcriptional regulator, leucine-responsive regulatory protein